MTLRFEDVERMIDEVLKPRALIPAPVRIIRTECALRDDGPKRRYARRRSRSDAHWRRINKKWLKRYGMQKAPAVLRMEYGTEVVLFVHPMLYRETVEAIRQWRGVDVQNI